MFLTKIILLKLFTSKIGYAIISLKVLTEKGFKVIELDIKLKMKGRLTWKQKFGLRMH